MKARLVCLALVLLAGASPASAQDVRYNFDSQADFASFKTYKWVTIKGATQFSDLVDKQIKAAVDAELAKKGLTRTDSDSADLYGKLGYTSAEVDVSVPGFGSASADDDGFLLGMGVRGRVAQQFELEGAVNYFDYSESGSDTSLGAAARWFFTDQFSAFAEGEFGDDVSTYGIGMRWNFGGNAGGQRVAQQK